MALSEPLAVVIGAAITGVLTGGPAVLIARRRPALRSPRRRGADQWQRQARELDQRLSAQYERQILRGEADNEDLQRQLAIERNRNEDLQRQLADRNRRSGNDQ